MSKKNLINLLRDTIDELCPFTTEHTNNSLSWNGNAYVKDSKSSFDRGATTWHAVLNALMHLIETQDHELNNSQKKYLKSLLLGGMGSFNDFYLEQKFAGDSTIEVNKRLDKIRDDFFIFFEND